MAALTVFHRCAENLTGRATAAITGGQFLKVDGAIANGENIRVGVADAGDPVIGVAGFDAASGELVSIVREGIVGLVAALPIIAGNAVEVADGGKVVPQDTGYAVGIAVTDIAEDATGAVLLYC